MTCYLLVDIDQFTIINTLMGMNKKVFLKTKSGNTNFTYYTIAIGSDEPLFIPRSINNMQNLKRIFIHNVTIKFINIDSSTLANLTFIKIEKCINRYGTFFPTRTALEKNHIKNIVFTINYFFEDYFS